VVDLPGRRRDPHQVVGRLGDHFDRFERVRVVEVAPQQVRVPGEEVHLVPEVVIEDAVHYLQPPLADFPVRDVRLEADVVSDLPVRVADRGDREPVPELLAVAPVVQDVDRRRPLVVDGLAERRPGLRVRPLALQEPAVPA